MGQSGKARKWVLRGADNKSNALSRDRFQNYPRYGGFWKREGAAKALVAEIEMK